jgi:hypothetical protein
MPQPYVPATRGAKRLLDMAAMIGYSQAAGPKRPRMLP